MGNVQPTEEYDMVIDINRMPNAEQNVWPVFLNTELQNILGTKETKDDEAFELLKLNKKEGVVGVFGLFNRGKTHLINKLVGVTLPSSKKVHTKGLSFKKGRENLNIILLDTAGSNSPMDKYFKQRGKEDAVTEKKTLELLIESVAFDLSDRVIVVVNEITWPDQEFLQILQKRLQKSSKADKSLYVVHNYADISSEEDLLFMWRSCVLSNMDVGNPVKNAVHIGNKEENIIFFREDPREEFPFPTLHYFIAKEDSVAGKKWNPRTYKYLQETVLRVNTTTHKQSVKDSLTASLLRSLQDFTRNPENVEWVCNLDYKLPKESPKEENQKITPDSFMVAPEIPEPISIGHLGLKCSGNLEYTHRASFDGFRIQLIQQRSDFKPPYDVVTTPNGISIMIDLCGVDEENINDPEIILPEPKGGNVQPLPPIVRFSGKRNLYVTDWLDLEANQSVELPYERKPTDLNDESKPPKYQWLHEEIGRSRSGGNYSIDVSLPLTINTSKAQMKLEIIDGMYCVFFPVIKESQASKPTRRERNKK